MEKKFIKKLEELKPSMPFVVTISTYNKKEKETKKIQNYLLINKFPKKEIDNLKDALVKMFDKEKDKKSLIYKAKTSKKKK